MIIIKLLFYKTGTIVGLCPINAKGLFILRELLEIFLREHPLYLCLIGRIDQGDAGALEAGTREAPAIDTREGAHDIIDGNELGGATLVIMDAGFAAIEREFAKEFEVARLPSGGALAHTTVLAIEVLGTTGKALGHGNARFIEGGLGDVAQEGFIERPQGLVGIGEHVPCGCLALVDAQVIVAVDQRACEA